jgi:hypothetical protein
MWGGGATSAPDGRQVLHGGRCRRIPNRLDGGSTKADHWTFVDRGLAEEPVFVSLIVKGATARFYLERLPAITLDPALTDQLARFRIRERVVGYGAIANPATR